MDTHMKLVAVLLAAISLIAIAGTCYFWPSGSDQRSAAFFAVLQFVAAFLLILLTFMYVATARQQLAQQNRPPRIVVRYHHVPNIDPFVLSLDVEVVNPSVSATSVGIQSFQLGNVSALDVSFEVNQISKPRLAIPSQELVRAVIKATNFNPPGFPIAVDAKTPTVILFDDIFHGTLPPVRIEV